MVAYVSLSTSLLVSASIFISGITTGSQDLALSVLIEGAIVNNLPVINLQS